MTEFEAKVLQELKEIKEEQRDIKLYIENKIEADIQQIAEGVLLANEKIETVDKRTEEILDNSEILKVFNEMVETKRK